MTMTMPGRITPTEDERRLVQDEKLEQQRFARLSKSLSTAGGHFFRPTIGNMLVILNDFEVWKGVLGLDNDSLILKKPPPFAPDYDIEGARVYPTELTEFDVDRVIIWFERKGKVLIETDQSRTLLKRALMLVARAR